MRSTPVIHFDIYRRRAPASGLLRLAIVLACSIGCGVGLILAARPAVAADFIRRQDEIDTGG
jgi:hypothetical protein